MKNNPRKVNLVSKFPAGLVVCGGMLFSAVYELVIGQTRFGRQNGSNLFYVLSFYSLNVKVNRGYDFQRLGRR